MQRTSQNTYRLIIVRIRYTKLAEHKVCPPIGLVNWCLDLEVEAHVIKTACSFVKECTYDMFKRAFQFKINTQILPTNDYLQRYRDTHCLGV